MLFRSSLMTTAGIIIAVTGAIIGLQQVIIPLVKKGRLMFSTWTDFIRDWNGEPAGSGREEIPGVMARLNRLDGELTHNGGSSLKDAVQRLEVNQENIYKKIEEAIEEKVPAILQSKEYAALDILERTQPIYETYQEKYPPSSMKSVPLSTISGLDTLSQQYAVTRPNASKQKSIGLIGSTLPRDYKQAVRFGATYGVIFFVIFLLLIALRLI